MAWLPADLVRWFNRLNQSGIVDRGNSGTRTLGRGCEPLCRRELGLAVRLGGIGRVPECDGPEELAPEHMVRHISRAHVAVNSGSYRSCVGSIVGRISGLAAHPGAL